MYLFIPSVFLVPICYDFEDILSMKKEAMLQQYSCLSDFKNKTINSRSAIIGVALPTVK